MQAVNKFQKLVSQYLVWNKIMFLLKKKKLFLNKNNPKKE